jgi:hypothetical protein
VATLSGKPFRRFIDGECDMPAFLRSPKICAS